MTRILVISPSYEDFRRYVARRGKKGICYSAWLSPLSTAGYQFEDVVFLPFWRMHPHFVQLNRQVICVRRGWWIFKRWEMVPIWRLAEMKGARPR